MSKKLINNLDYNIEGGVPEERGGGGYNLYLQSNP